MLLNHGLINKAGAVLPACRGPIECVMQLKSVRVCLGDCLELLSYQDVVLGYTRCVRVQVGHDRKCRRKWCVRGRFQRD